MAHETHHGNAQQGTENAPKTSLNSSFWFILIVVFVFIAGVNFVRVMGEESGHESGGHHNTEATHDGHAEHGNANAAALHHDADAQGTQPAPDTAHHGEAHH